MKNAIISIILSFSFLAAIDLPAYVAEFDKELAIELYNTEIRNGNDAAGNYQALAELYDQTGKVGLAEDCYRHLIKIQLDKESAYKSYLNFLYQNRSFKKVRGIINENEFDKDWSHFLVAKSYFNEGKFDSSFTIAGQLPEELAGRLMNFSHEGLQIKYRSPVLGGIMSAVIPGSGKAYAGRLLDGMQAFSVVLAPAYNAYYHFNKTGPTSVRAWIWTAVASWFYLSDIYGSVKAVIEYNEMEKMKVIERYGE